MNRIVKAITIDVVKKNKTIKINAKQYDNKTRFINATITNEGEKLTIGSDKTVLINGLREDGLSKSFKGSVVDGTVLVPITYWMLENEGLVECDISVIGTDEETLTTKGFYIDVEAASRSNKDVSEDENSDFLLSLIKNVNNIKREDIDNATKQWLDEHPEATTTVEDQSLTINKMVIGTLGYITPQMFGAVGDGETDDTGAINSMFEFLQNGSVAYFPYATYRVSKECGVTLAKNRWCAIKVENKNNIKIVLSPGAKIKCDVVEGEELTQVGILYVKECDNVEISGGIIEGEGKEHYGNEACNQVLNSGINGLEIRASSNVHIHDMTIHNCFGDGIIVIPFDSESKQLENITTENCTIYDCMRNGISYESIKNGIIRNCTIYNIKNYAPQAGIDLESEWAVHNSELRNQNILIEGCNIYDCGEKAICCSTESYDVTVLNCTSNSNFVSGNARGDNFLIQNSVFNSIGLSHNCKVENCKCNTMAVVSYLKDDGEYEAANAEIYKCEFLGSALKSTISFGGRKEIAKFKNCIMKYLPQNEGLTHRLLSVSGRILPVEVVFENCEFYIENVSQALLECSAENFESISFVKCNFYADTETFSRPLIVGYSKYAKIIDCVFDFTKLNNWDSGGAWDSLFTLRTKDAESLHHFANNKLITKEAETPIIKYFFNFKGCLGKAYLINNYAPNVADINNPLYVEGELISYGNITSATLEKE